MKFIAVYLAILPLASSFTETVVKSVTTETKLGPVKGLETKVPGSDATVLQYRRIPFAKPPVGDLRFSKPEPHGAWEGVLDGTEFGPSCVQGDTKFFNDVPNHEQSEDCLFLNIYVPSTPKEDKRSVMVWIHGGGYSAGQGMFYNASNLAASGDVIVVTINYRLGVFGFLTLSEPRALGNYGLWDQIEALRWVNSNIEAFGGDKESVTIFGESAGGFSVSLLALVPSNKGLFQRVIAQSGTAHSPYALSPVAAMGSRMVSKFLDCGEEDVETMLSCMRGKSAEDVLKASAPSNFGSPSDFHLVIGFGPVIDGELFPDLPMRLMSDSYPDVLDFFKSLDFMAGTTSQEGSLIYLILSSPAIQQKNDFLLYEGIPTKVFKDLVARTLVATYFQNNGQVLKALSEQYTDTVSLATQSMRTAEMYSDFFFVGPAIQTLKTHALDNGLGKTFQYEVSRISPLPFGLPPPSWFKGCGHADELLYLFGMKIKELQGHAIVQEDLVLAEKMMKYWSNFAKSGNPNIPKQNELAVWPEFDIQSQMYLSLDSPLDVKHHLKDTELKFWAETLPSLMLSENHSSTDKKDEL